MVFFAAVVFAVVPVFFAAVVFFSAAVFVVVFFVPEAVPAAFLVVFFSVSLAVPAAFFAVVFAAEVAFAVVVFAALVVFFAVFAASSAAISAAVLRFLGFFSVAAVASADFAVVFLVRAVVAEAFSEAMVVADFGLRPLFAGTFTSEDDALAAAVFGVVVLVLFTAGSSTGSIKDSMTFFGSAFIGSGTSSSLKSLSIGG